MSAKVAYENLSEDQRAVMDYFYDAITRELIEALHLAGSIPFDQMLRIVRDLHARKVIIISSDGETWQWKGDNAKIAQLLGR